MFLYNIAFSLEFIVIALGAFLIGWARYKSACSYKGARDDLRTNVTSTADTSHGHHHKMTCGTGFASVVGIILIILALCNFGDTIYNAVNFENKVSNLKERIEILERGPANNSPRGSDRY